MVTNNYYAVLGLLHTAEPVVVKAAFKALAQRYHPDKFKGDPELARTKMKDLNEAYRVLSNPQQRQAHDRELMGDLATLDQGFAEWIQAFVDAKRHGD